MLDKDVQIALVTIVPAVLAALPAVLAAVWSWHAKKSAKESLIATEVGNAKVDAVAEQTEVVRKDVNSQQQRRDEEAAAVAVETVEATRVANAERIEASLVALRESVSEAKIQSEHMAELASTNGALVAELASARTEIARLRAELAARDQRPAEPPGPEPLIQRRSHHKAPEEPR